MARLLVVSRSMALAMRLADVHEVIEHPVEAIDQLPSPELVDVVVLDVGEPTTAIHALDQVRAGGDSTPVLIVSGYQPAWASLVSIDIPGVMVVPLPITRAALLDGVAELARSRPDHRSSQRDRLDHDRPDHDRSDHDRYRAPDRGDLRDSDRGDPRDSDGRSGSAEGGEPPDLQAPLGWQGPPEWLLGVRDEPARPTRDEPQHARRAHPPEPRAPEQSPTGIAVVQHSIPTGGDGHGRGLGEPVGRPDHRQPPNDPADANDDADPASEVRPDADNPGYEPDPALMLDGAEQPQEPDNTVATDHVDDDDHIDADDDVDDTDAVDGMDAGWDELIAPGQPGASSPTPNWNPSWMRRAGPRPPMLHARDGGERSDGVPNPAPERDHWSTDSPGPDAPSEIDESAVEESAVEESAVEESAVDDPAVDDFAVDDPAVDDPAVPVGAEADDPVADDPEIGHPDVPVDAGSVVRGLELWWEGPQPPPLPITEGQFAERQIAEPAITAGPISGQTPRGAQIVPPPASPEPELPKPPPLPAMPAVGALTSPLEPATSQPSKPVQAPPESPRLLLPPPLLRASQPEDDDGVTEDPSPAQPVVGATDTRSLILPYPVDGVRLGRPNGWAGQDFDWWHTDRGIAPEPVAPDLIAPEPFEPEPFEPEPVAPEPVTPEPVPVDAVLVDRIQVDPVRVDPVIDPDPGRFAPPEPVLEEAVSFDDPTVESATGHASPDSAGHRPDSRELREPAEVFETADETDDAATDEAAPGPELEPAPRPEPEPIVQPEPVSEPLHLRPAAAALARRRELLGLPDRPQGPSELDQRLAGVPFQTSFGPGGTSAELVALGLRHDVTGVDTGEAAVLDRPTGRAERPERPIVATRPSLEAYQGTPGHVGRLPAAGAAGGHARHGAEAGFGADDRPHPVTGDSPRSLDTADLVEAMSERVGELFGVSDTAQLLAAEIVEIADADAAAVLVPDGGLWRVSGGVGLRPPERRLVLDAGHWLVSEIAVGGRALLVEDTDIVRPKLAGAPLAAWRHLLAIPIPEVRSAVVLARGYEAGAFGEQDLAAVVEPVRRSVSLMRTALQTRQLARLLTPLRETEALH